jgi:Spy/CpxP family protein refolding chaperone
MKKHILNRPMFRQVKSPAYGTGIASNLVSNEERQKYNDGGRVGFSTKGYAVPWQIKEGNRIYDKYYEDLDKSQLGPYGYEMSPEYGGYKVKEWDDLSGTEELPGIGELQFSEYYDRNDYRPYKVGTADAAQPGILSEKDIIARGVIAPERKGSFEDLSMQELLKEQAGEKGDVFIDQRKKLEELQPTTDEEIIKRKSMIEEGTPAVTGKDDKWHPGVQHSGLPGGIIKTDDMPKPIDDKTDTLDIEDIVDKYYDKKGSLGAAQLGLAGQVLKAGFLPKKDAMGTVGDAMGQFGKNISEDKKAFEKLAATGEIQRELYRMSRAEEGKQDRATLKYKNELTEWLKKNGAEEEEISDIMKYNSSLKNWGDVKDLTGQQHQNLVGGFDEEFAANSIVMDMQVTGTGKDRRIGFSQSDLDAFAQIDEGSPIFIGNKVYIKDSSVQGSATQPQGMREVNYTQLKLLKNKPKKEKPFKRFQ